eukprot:TRINITY_DN110800_c0_g1_i1.p1 TRINITY_DN110800_c0_g1~~TRINITY_DN110800_c0_g1_i1.p1  ORF type:complete len:291 (-),score=26.05 TRINITY_DN110800_c0_g1_i1:168-956(-)
MVKVRVQLVPDFGLGRGEVQWSGAVESSYSEVIKVVQNKLKLKVMKEVTLYYADRDHGTRRSLPHGDLSEVLQNDMQILVSLDKASAAGYSGQGDETTTSAITPITISVMALNGESFTLDAISSDTIRSVKTKIQESRGVNTGRQKLLLAEVELSDESKLEDSGISAETPLQLLVVSGFDIRLADLKGPNSPRYGCTSQYTWEMKCDCGYMDRWVHADGYDFYSMSKQLDKTCPMCGAECRTKPGGPGGVPTEFPNTELKGL